MITIQEFNKYAELVKQIDKRPSDEELLELYALYKQTTIGDCTGGKKNIRNIVKLASPGMLDFKGKAKYKAWMSKEGMSKEDASNQYIELAKTIIEKQ